MPSIRNQDSHIQLPKSFQKPFSKRCTKIIDDHSQKIDEVAYYDLKDSSIKQSSIKELGTKHGYYSKEIELVLSNYVEKPISSLRDKSYQIKKGFDVTFTDADCLNFINYIIWSSLRNSKKAKELEEKLNIPKNQQVTPVREAILGAICVYQEKFLQRFNLLNSFLVGIVSGDSERSFVLPQSGFFIVDWPSHSSSNVFVIPFLPQISIGLVPNQFKKYYPKRIVTLSSDDITLFNRTAFLFEQHSGQGFVIGLQEELIRFQSDLNWKS